MTLEPDFVGDLVNKLKKIVGSDNFSVHFIKIISHYKKIGYNNLAHKVQKAPDIIWPQHHSGVLL